MNAKQRNQNRSTAEALHYAIQTPAVRFGKVQCARFPVGKAAKREAQAKRNDS